MMSQKSVPSIVSTLPYSGALCLVAGFASCQVFTRRGLEKNPTLNVKLALEDRPCSGYGVHRPGLSDEEAGLVARLLDRVKLFADTEGLIVKVTMRLADLSSFRLAPSAKYDVCHVYTFLRYALHLWRGPPNLDSLLFQCV